MARKLKKSKVSICVFCEGESEQAYTDFLKSKFQDVAVFKRPSSTGLFDDADNRFKKDPKYRDYADVIDEIWFFFDVEEKDIDNWSKRLEIIKRLRRLRKKPQIRVRLLMTTGCIEYWLMLHYRLFAPPVLTVPEKEQIHIVLQVHFLNAGVEVGGPVAVVADGNQSAVQSQRSILTGGGLVQDDIGNVLAGIQCQRNLGRVVRNRNGLNVQVDVAALLHFGKGEPVFFIMKGSIIRQINSDVDGVLIGVIRGAGFGGSGSGICGRLSCAGSDRGRTAASTGGQSACCHAGGQSHGQGTAD